MTVKDIVKEITKQVQDYIRKEYTTPPSELRQYYRGYVQALEDLRQWIKSNEQEIQD